MTSIGTQLFTLFKGRFVGEDEFGNRYYTERRRPKHRRERRWVIYKGEVEGSRVPASWHGWLHHSSDIAPSEQAPEIQPWERRHQPNMTGTPAAYRPPGHLLGRGQRDKATGDYEPWRPE